MATHHQASYVYRTSLDWKHQQTGIASASGRPPLSCAPPTEFGGPGTEWTPEELLLAAVESCMMSTFLVVARRRNIAVTSYASTATGTLGKTAQGMAFVDVALSVRIGIPMEESRALALQVAETAHKSCFIANSLKAPVTLHVEVAVGGIAA